ncbi:DUF456 domain-containing protein [Flavobacterium agrisoli]|uniref:DUF456 domain-containing protein n=1 Tax=Flavobacterium agrisoli TaxID=2793066 RepID=A0A934PP70_9FLAO|nr:DUF456 domain-containing protein [Flavobacterium agrisoli]MBK0370553.1 DUF456 domain-containing protein [Flavobacterium agrisoli]
MVTLLLILGLICMIVGVLGSVLPILPGISISWLGLLFLYCSGITPMNYWFLGGTFLIVVLVSILNYVIPAQGTKKFGGSSYGVWGTNIGLIVGILAPIPFGFIIGPFVGAFVGELLYNSKEHKRAFRAAVGSFTGFLASTFMSFMLAFVFLCWFLYLVMQNI